AEMDFVALIGKPLEDSALHQCELELGRVTKSADDDRAYFTFTDGGVSINADAETMRPTMITFYQQAGKTWDGKPFVGALPLGARFGMTRAERHVLFGPPTDTRSWWDKWDRGDVVVRAEYAEKGQGPMA